MICHVYSSQQFHILVATTYIYNGTASQNAQRPKKS